MQIEVNANECGTHIQVSETACLGSDVQIYTRYGQITMGPHKVKASIRNAKTSICIDGMGYAEIALTALVELDET